jgi:hypothetical protein
MGGTILVEVGAVNAMNKKRIPGIFLLRSLDNKFVFSWGNNYEQK